MLPLLLARWILGGAASGAELSPQDQALVAQLRLPYQQEVLDNGLRLVVQQDPRAPLVASHLLLPLGAAADRGGPGWTDLPGLAHLCEHLLYAGSPGAPEGGYDAMLAAAGGENNAWTEHHGLALHAVVPVEALDLLLWLEADRLQALDPPSVAARLDTERAVVAQERALDLERPGGLDGAALRALLYPADHPERWPVLGTPAALEAVTTAEVLAFHRAALAPEGAVLVLVGDLEPDDAVARVRDGLGRVAPRPRPPQPPPPPAPLVPGRGLHLDDVAGTTLVAAWPLPPPDHPDAPAVDLLADLLGQQRHGHLGGLRARGRLERAAAWVELTPQGGRLVVELGARRGPATRLLRHLDAALAEVQRGPPPSPPEVERLRARWRSWAARVLLSPPDRAEVLAACTQEHGDPGCFPDHLARHLAVDGPAIQAAARQWLAEDRRALLTVVSPGHARRALPGSRRIELSELRP